LSKWSLHSRNCSRERVRSRHNRMAVTIGLITVNSATYLVSARRGSRPVRGISGERTGKDRARPDWPDRRDGWPSVRRFRRMPDRFSVFCVLLGAIWLGSLALWYSRQTQPLVETLALREVHWAVTHRFGAEFGNGEIWRETQGDSTDFGCLRE
jgi:hypothetical protein